MPPKKSLSGRSSTRKTRQSTRRREVLDDGIPNIYGEMLAEAVAEERDSSRDGRSSKRRKISEEPSSKIELDFDLFGSSQVATDAEPNQAAPEETPPKLQQVVFDDFEGSDESEAEFEDVELEPAEEGDEAAGTGVAEPEQKPLDLDLSKAGFEPSRQGPQRRRPVGPAERKMRLEVHKAHLVCLLAHLSSRNHWCESESLHAILKPIVPRKLISLLHVDESQPQYQRSHSFMKGIEELCAMWRQQWTITAKGMQRAHWKEDVDVLKESDDAEDLIDLDDFKAAAHSRSGSRDLGAQLFCALLRSVAVDTRLVCSLQVLPFSAVAKGHTPEKPKPQYYHAPPQNYTQNSTITRPERSTPKKKKKIVESPYPIFWVEVYSPSTSTWIPLDPIVRNTINKPKTGFEPPASDRLNSMTYVIAFEDDGSAKDVTRRYAQWYNAKTRKQRVESTKGGEQWWARTMGALQKPFAEIRDEIEDASLLKRAESEAMPRNVQDFKGHPVYVLERHLRVNEVIHPKHEVGKVSTGSSKNAKLESVFRRRDVHICRTADAWYRRGRDVKEGEQPLKRVTPKRRRTPEDIDDDDDEANEGMALYAEYQTKLYEPPAVVDGKIPKNAYGNLDVYVPSMIPPGAVHVRHPLAAQAARVLGIDYADAVTGFAFKGRQGTAVVDGVVVSMQMCNAMIHVIEGLESQATEEVEQARSRVILGLWKRWLTALRVRERVHRDYGDREEDTVKREGEDEDDPTSQDDGEDYGGGFMPDIDEGETAQAKLPPDLDTIPALSNLKPVDQLLPPEVIHQPVVVVRSPHKLPQSGDVDLFGREPTDAGQHQDGVTIQQDEYGGGGFMPEDTDPQPTEAKRTPGQAVDVDMDEDDEEEDDDGGGDAGPGGFLPEDEDMPSPPQTVQQTKTDKDEEFDDTAGGFIVEEDESETPGNTGTSITYQGTGPPQSSRPGIIEPAMTTSGATASNIATKTHTQLPIQTSGQSTVTTAGTATTIARTTSSSATHNDTAVGDTTAGETTITSTNATANTNTKHQAPKSVNPTSSTAHLQTSHTQTDLNHEPEPEPELPRRQSSPTASLTSQSQTSLLSHDPDEEDAEPEWLLESLGEID